LESSAFGWRWLFPERPRDASLTADGVLSREEGASFFLTDIFGFVTDSQLALDGHLTGSLFQSRGKEGKRVSE
jgi:hypothetical protein